MNRHGLICRCIDETPTITQREIAQALDVSLGTANRLVRECLEQQLIAFYYNEESYQLLPKGRKLLESYRVDGALIIAAGFGSRFVPLTFEMPKGLLEVFGERMIERQIKQLHEVGIFDITIAVGYLKEKFEYLIDKYQVKLLYNPEYSTKNTLTTVYRAASILKGRNMYLLSSDNWMRNNMFHTYECGAWYSSAFMRGNTSEWCLSYNKKGKIIDVNVGGRDAWVMYGPVYFSKEFSDIFIPALEASYKKPGTEQYYWEQVYLELVKNGSDIEMYANRQPEDQVYEFENLEELRMFDSRYQTHSDNAALELISGVFQVPESEINDIRCLKAGMTNKSFLFQIHGKHYICRIPGPGTELLINRNEEKEVYEVVTPLKITEKILYFEGKTGYKIAKYYDGARNAQADNPDDMECCLEILQKLHGSQLSVNHRFDIGERIDFYEKLCRSHGSILFEDYDMVKGWMGQLLSSLKKLKRPDALAHIDPNVDNFLVLPDGGVRLIDWEYAGMCDPLIDVSMWAIYSYYGEEQIRSLTECYLKRPASSEERFVIYSYIALGGFLWSLWAVYKSALGEEFGEYTIIMYRYAKNFYRKLKDAPELIAETEL